MISSFQVGGAFYICAGAFLVIAVVSLVFVRDNPEDVGLYPDNDQSMTREKAQALFEVGESYRKSSPWTISKLLRTKQVWQISIGTAYPADHRGYPEYLLSTLATRPRADAALQ